jgi:hypothetical protein
MAEGMMSPSDVAVMMHDRNNGWNDGMGFMWIFALLILANGGFGGWGNNAANALGYENLATSNEVQRGFDNQNSMANEREILAAVNATALQGMQNNNQNTQYMTGMLNDKYNELQRDVAGVAMMQQQGIANQAQCCCETKMLISETAAQQRYDSAMQNNAVLQAIQAEGAAIRQQADQRYMAEQDRRIANLEMQNAMAGVIRYPMSTAYSAGYNPFCNCCPNMFGNAA